MKKSLPMKLRNASINYKAILFVLFVLLVIASHCAIGQATRPGADATSKTGINYSQKVFKY